MQTSTLIRPEISLEKVSVNTVLTAFRPLLKDTPQNTLTFAVRIFEILEEKQYDYKFVAFALNETAHGFIICLSEKNVEGATVIGILKTLDRNQAQQYVDVLNRKIFDLSPTESRRIKISSTVNYEVKNKTYEGEAF